MFCPSCGTESTGLNFCNRCGANLTSALTPPNEAAPINVTKPILIIGLVMLFLTLGGFAGILSSTIDLTARASGGDLPLAIVSFGTITILTIDVLLFTLMWKLINAALSSHRISPKKQQSLAAEDPQRFARPITNRLQPALSVTENTTRFFESGYREPQPTEAHRKVEE